MTHASAQTIGLAMPRTDDPFRAVIGGSVEAAAAAAGLKLAKTDAQNDPGLQVENVRQLIKDGVASLVVLGGDSKAEVEIARLARAADVPLVFVNHMPSDEVLGGQVVYVGSNEVESGTLQAEETCRLMGGRGTAVIMIGELNHPAARMRTLDVHEVFSRPDCRGIEILEEQSANWDRAEGKALLEAFLDGGLKPDAVIANNDEMALGAIQAAKEAGIKPIVAGIDATDDALAAMVAGDLSLSVLQDGKAQGALGLELARQMAAGKSVDTLNWIPFSLVRSGDAAALAAKRAQN
ncbi:substrate-binding domain-containing protein [Antarcticirhabdus aurantiaca]|uniref:Substrate-binding domain-containing protein n=2 Tax=Antarcticirhabdus aurantiaca TaxID=2606717 RepID=A0ACD4NIB1_9HYPH|nr:substrate-binding domain-containing protein [Jeongeuplla avenae]